MAVTSIESRRRSAEPLQRGITHAQGWEVMRRFMDLSEAPPTIARRMGIDQTVVDGVIDGKVWPGVQAFWLEHGVVVAS